jgi:hypothetical protein
VRRIAGAPWVPPRHRRGTTGILAFAQRLFFKGLMEGVLKA